MSSGKLKLFVYYYIQNDAFDGLTEPNIYALPFSFNNANEVKGSHVYNSFPLNFENFYLRFYLDDPKQNMKLWMDFPPSATLPVYKDKIYAKVLRLPKHVKPLFKDDGYYLKGPINSKKEKENHKEIDPNINNKTILHKSPEKKPGFEIGDDIDWTKIGDDPIKVESSSPSQSQNIMTPYDKFVGDEDSIKEQIDAFIKEWMYSFGEKKNLRMVLATLHEVWFTDKSWKDVSMQTLVEDTKAVDTYKRKAYKQLHHDKNRDQDFRVQYVAECLFHILNTATVQLTK